MQMHAGMAQQLALDKRCLVSAGVVQHQVQVQPRQSGSLDGGQEVPEIDTAVAPVHLADHCACPHIERGEQVRGAVADVVVRERSSWPGRMGSTAACICSVEYFCLKRT